MILLLGLMPGMLSQSNNVSIGHLLPLLHVDLLAEIKFALDASQNLLENLIREVSIHDLVDLVFRNLTLAEGKGSVLDHSAHLLW